jgi:hypothetical protein
MNMPRIMLIAIALGFFATTLTASTRQPGKGPNAMFYELYSWQEPNGSWSFCVLASPGGVNLSAEQVFNKKFLLSGIKELKAKISGLPVGATVYWPNRISGRDQKATESKGFRYPPPEVIEDIRNFAESHKIKIEMPSGQPEQK